MPAIDLSILNQRQTPAFYADTLANRPAAGFVGRIFVSTNTFAFYRDNGTGWDLIGGPGTGTITGSGAAGQVSFWNGASTITGENNLWWDSTNNHFGINTNTPGTAADIHHDQSTLLQLNQTTATNDTRIAFQNAGSSKWRIGNFYSAGSNDYKVNDAVLNINRFTIKSSSGQTFVGDEVTSSGLFVVNNSSSDAHIVALGATAPSIRVRNAGTGASLQFGLGLATTTNNFIQGATGGEFCIFNDSLTAQPILFGIKDAGLGNTQEAARISAARNFLIGTTTDSGQKLIVNGTALITGGVTFNSTLSITTSSTVLSIDRTGAGTALIEQKTNGTVRGYIGSDVSTPFIVFNETAAERFRINSSGSILLKGSSTTTNAEAIFENTNSLLSIESSASGSVSKSIRFNTSAGATMLERMRIAGDGNIGIGTTTPSEKLEISGTGNNYISVVSTNASDAGIKMNSAGNRQFGILSDGNLRFYDFTSSADRMRIVGSTGNVLIGTTTDAGQKLQVAGIAQATSFRSINGTKSIASGATEAIYSIPASTSADGTYFVHVEVTSGSAIYMASGVVTAIAGNGEAFFTSFYDGTNVTLSVSGLNIQVTNGGFSTFTWSYSILLQANN